MIYGPVRRAGCARNCCANSPDVGGRWARMFNVKNQLLNMLRPRPAEGDADAGLPRHPPRVKFRRDTSLKAGDAGDHRELAGKSPSVPGARAHSAPTLGALSAPGSAPPRAAEG